MRNVAEVYRVQILLAYFLNRIDRPCTPEQLLEIAIGEGIVNYFDYTAAVSAMLENGTIELTENSGEEYYRLTEKGRSGAENFKKQVKKSLRDRIYASGLRLFAKLKNERDIGFEVVPVQGGFDVHCKYSDGELTLMDMRLFAENEASANYIRSKIRLNPTDFYCRIIDTIDQSGRSGAEDADEVEKNSLRNDANAAELYAFARTKNGCAAGFEVSPEQRGYNVRCKYTDGGLAIMDIRLYAPDEDQADYIMSKIKAAPVDFYYSIIDYIIENDEYMPSVLNDEMN